jgi:hypothetical protein
MVVSKEGGEGYKVYHKERTFYGLLAKNSQDHPLSTSTWRSRGMEFRETAEDRRKEQDGPEIDEIYLSLKNIAGSKE